MPPAAPLWLTAREIAEAMLPGLPTSPRGRVWRARAWAGVEGWSIASISSRPKHGRL